MHKTASLRWALLPAVAAAMLLAGCQQQNENRVAFDGIYFKAKAHEIGDDRARFAVAVQKAAQSIDGALQAARYEGTKYCIANYGTSRIRWDQGPDTPAEQVVLQDGELVLAGECNP